ncbi:MAG: FAD-dependent oxidoreductase [Candidatus Omnitrophota bacterium]
MLDLIIIGAGPSGITAGVYAARKKIDTLVITRDVGGQAAWSGDVENYTGYQFISGPELAAKFQEHMSGYNIPVRENESVTSLDVKGKAVSVVTDKSEYAARTVIIASGKRTKELNVPGEQEFKNRGLTYCATCDGPLFSGREVAVIGGGNSALDAVLQLIRIARRVYLININSSLNADEIMCKKAGESSLVTILNDTEVTAILGDKMVNGIKIKRQGREEVLALGGVFVEIGLIPNSEFAKGLKKNELGEIKVNPRNETNLPAVFAAGDVTDVPEKQIIIAAGEGAKAALSVFSYLARHNDTR